MNDDGHVPGHTVCGIYCSMCKRRISKNIPPTLTYAEIDKVTREIEAKHMEWHRSKMKPTGG